MSKVYLITTITGETFAFMSESARKEWMKSCYCRAKDMTRGYMNNMTFEEYWKEAILFELPIIA